jgi:hypothetical protein
MGERRHRIFRIAVSKIVPVRAALCTRLGPIATDVGPCWPSMMREERPIRPGTTEGQSMLTALCYLSVKSGPPTFYHIAPHITDICVES